MNEKVLTTSPPGENNYRTSASSSKMSTIDSTVEILYTKIFINNQWCEASNGKTFPVINPSTGEEICHVQEATRVWQTLCV